MKTILLIGTAVAAVSAPVPLAAHEAMPGISQSHSPAGPPDPNGGLADIVVTAQRRAETAQRAAVAIDVVSPQELTRAGVVTATMLNATVPALTVQQGGGANTTFFVRGVGNFTNNGYSDPAIAFNLDGIYLGRPTSTTGTFFDLERIEVLKGPQDGYLLRSRADRGLERAAGNALWPQCHWWRHQRHSSEAQIGGANSLLFRQFRELRCG